MALKLCYNQGVSFRWFWVFKGVGVIWLRLFLVYGGNMYFDTDSIKVLVEDIPPIENIISDDEIKEALKSKDGRKKLFTECKRRLNEKYGDINS